MNYCTFISYEQGTQAGPGDGLEQLTGHRTARR